MDDHLCRCGTHGRIIQAVETAAAGERGRAMSWDDDGNELVVDGPTAFPVSRRDFLKLTSTGVLVLMSVEALADQETARPQTGRQGYPPT